jgi:hypothetical protein
MSDTLHSSPSCVRSRRRSSSARTAASANSSDWVRRPGDRGGPPVATPPPVVGRDEARLGQTAPQLREQPVAVLVRARGEAQAAVARRDQVLLVRRARNQCDQALVRDVELGAAVPRAPVEPICSDHDLAPPVGARRARLLAERRPGGPACRRIDAPPRLEAVRVPARQRLRHHQQRTPQGFGERRGALLGCQGVRAGDALAGGPPGAPVQLSEQLGATPRLDRRGGGEIAAHALGRALELLRRRTVGGEPVDREPSADPRG